MAWALHAADHGFSQEQIKNEILCGRDLLRKGSRPRQFDYAARTASKAIAMSTVAGGYRNHQMIQAENPLTVYSNKIATYSRKVSC
jgi:hypothetical protein